MKNRISYAAIIGIALILTSCTNPEPTDSTPRTLDDFYRWTEVRARQLEDDYHRAVGACMKARGFEYVVTEVRSAPPAEGTGTFTEMLRTLASSQRDGSPELDHKLQELEHKSAAYHTALGKRGESGCHLEAEQTIPSEIFSPEEMAILESTLGGLATDAELLEAGKRWERCMSEAGHDVDPGSSGDVSAILEARAVSILHEWGYSMPRNALDNIVELVSAQHIAALSEALAPIENEITLINQECSTRSGVEQIQNEYVALAVASLPKNVFELRSTESSQTTP